MFRVGLHLQKSNCSHLILQKSKVSTIVFITILMGQKETNKKKFWLKKLIYNQNNNKNLMIY